MQSCMGALWILLRSFNTVNGIRVHAISSIHLIKADSVMGFQYRKRYKGACNKEYRIVCVDFDCSFNTVNGIRVHAMTRDHAHNSLHHVSIP